MELFFFEMYKKKNLGQFSKNYRTFYPKIVLSGVLLYCLRTILMGRRSLKQVSVLKSVSADTGNLDFFLV